MVSSLGIFPVRLLLFNRLHGHYVNQSQNQFIFTVHSKECLTLYQIFGPTIMCQPIYDQRAVKFLQEFEIRKLRERGWDGPS